MKERPIFFSGEMVRAILDGKKTQTRRIIKEQPEVRDGMLELRTKKPTGKPPSSIFRTNDWSLLKEWMRTIECPYGNVGDRLWVRETWGEFVRRPGHIVYRADDPLALGSSNRWKPSIHMPRWASRITMEVTGVRVERLQDISGGDARAEGILDGGCLNCGCSEPCGCDNPSPDARDTFAYLWDSINEKSGFGWRKNPWVWVIEFKKVK